MTAPTPGTRPEPVKRAGVIAGAIAGLVLAAGAVLHAFGLVADDATVKAIAQDTSDVVLGIGTLWATLAPLVLALHARTKVTPLESPRDALGRILEAVEAGTLGTLDVGHALDELLPPVDGVVTSTSSSAGELAPASLYDELVAEHAGGPPTVELEAVRPVADTAPPVPATPAPAA